jgi:hypothetical protein
MKGREEYDTKTNILNEMSEEEEELKSVVSEEPTDVEQGTPTE